MRIGCAGVPVVAVGAEPLPVLVKSGRVEYATSTAQRGVDALWNGPSAALMSYGALPLVGSTTRIVTVGLLARAPCPRPLSTSYLNFAAASCSGSRCASLGAQVAEARRRAVARGALVVGRGDAAVVRAGVEIHGVVARAQVSRLTVRRQLLACGVSVSLSWWQVWQLRWSCG